MSKIKCNILIPLSGLGVRFSNAGFSLPKPFINVLEESMIRTVIKNLNFPGAHFSFIINSTQISKINFTNHINYLIDDFSVFTVEKLTEGPAVSCLIAEEEINKNIPLIIVNCDQIILDFDIDEILNFAIKNNCDGVVGCFLSLSPKNSYVKLNQNLEIELVKEKEVISNIATNGLHFWKNGIDFIESTKSMIENNERYNGEFYIAPTYNSLIKKGKKILPFFYNLHFPIGTPEDLELFKTKMGYGNI